MGLIKDVFFLLGIRQAIERLEADRTASRKREDNQPKLTAFYINSTCSDSKTLDSDKQGHPTGNFEKKT